MRDIVTLIQFCSHSGVWGIDDTIKGGLTIFWELFTVIPCAPRHLNVNNIDIWVSN